MKTLLIIGAIWCVISGFGLGTMIVVALINARECQKEDEKIGGL